MNGKRISLNVLTPDCYFINFALFCIKSCLFGHNLQFLILSVGSTESAKIWRVEIFYILPGRR